MMSSTTTPRPTGTLRARFDGWSRSGLVMQVSGGTLEKSIRSVALEGQVAFIGRLARLRPLIDRVSSFDEVPPAFRYFEAGKCFGKVVIIHA